VRAVSLSLCLCLLFAWGADAQEVEHARYELSARLDPERHVLEATQRVTYPNDGEVALATLYFLLSPNFAREPNPHLSPVVVDAGYWNGFDPAWLEVQDVTDGDGNALPWRYEAGPAAFQTYSLAQTLLAVELPAPLAPGAQATVEIRFETKFPHSNAPDEGRHQDHYTWRFAWNPVAVPAQQLIDGNYVDPQKDFHRWIYPAALYELTLTVPEDFRVASGFNAQEEVARADGERTLRLNSEVPVRSAALSMGPDFRLYELPSPHGPVRVYHRPGEAAAARQLATYAVEALGAYSARWGAYGYDGITFVSSWAPGLFGMAADGIVILGNGVFREKDLTVAGIADRLVEYLVAHELAHQWWGVGIGIDFNAENYLSEGFAEYLSITYFEDKYGPEGGNVIRLERDGLVEGAVESQLGYLNLREHFSELPYVEGVKNRFDEALAKPQKQLDYLNQNAVRVYNKGYQVLRALAGLITPEAMDETLRRAYQRFNHGLFDSADLRALAEEVSGRDLETFFAHWVHGDARLDYAITRVKEQRVEGGGYQVQVSLSRRGEGALPAEVVVVTEDEEEISRSWDPEADGDVLAFETGAPLAEVRLDPGSWVPDSKRINNYYPTRVEVLPNGGNALPLDAYLIRLDPVNQTVEGGFLNEYRWVLADGFVAFALNQGRGSQLDGALGVGLENFAAEFGYTLTGYRHPEVGIQGQLWEPSHWARLSLSRRLDADGGAVNYAGARYRFTQSLQDVAGYGVELLTDPRAFARLSLSASHRSLLVPNVTLDLSATAGYSVGALPGMLHFTLAELNGFYEQTENGRRKLAFPDRTKGLARLAVNFPWSRDLAYSLLGLALVREVRGRVYLSAGDTWPDLDAVSLDEVKVELGIEATVLGQSFGGLLGFDLTAGVAVPLAGPGSAGPLRFEPYIGIGAPLF